MMEPSYTWTFKHPLKLSSLPLLTKEILSMLKARQDMDTGSDKTCKDWLTLAEMLGTSTFSKVAAKYPASVNIS